MNWPRPTPLDVLKWTGVAFIVVLEALIVVSIVLVMVGDAT